MNMNKQGAIVPLTSLKAQVISFPQTLLKREEIFDSPSIFISTTPFMWIYSYFLLNNAEAVEYGRMERIEIGIYIYSTNIRVEKLPNDAMLDQLDVQNSEK
jgi:hypothetical protein